MVGGKLGRYERRTAPGRSASTPGRACSPCRRSSPTCSPRPVDLDGWTWSGSIRWSGTSSPTAPRSTPRRTRPRSPAGSRPRSATGPPPTGARLWRRAGRVWRRVLARTSCAPRWTHRCDLARLAWRLRRPGRDRARAAPCAALGRVVPARPAAADAARPVRHLHRLRPAPGAGRAGRDPVRRADLRRLVPARRPGHAGRRAAGPRARRSACASHTGTPVAGDRRRPAAGSRGVRLADGDAGAGRRRGGQRRRRRGLPRPAARRRRRPRPAAPTRSLGGFVLLLGVRGRTPGLAHHTVFFPADYDAEFDAIFGGPARPGRRPDGLRHRRRRPGRAPGRARGVVRAGQRRRRTGRRASTGARPGWPTRTPTGCCDVAGAARAWTSATGSLFREMRTPADLEAATGDAGRRDLRHAQPRADRRCSARQPRARSRGLYLVGGSAHPGGGLPMVALSAAIVADHIGPPTRSLRRGRRPRHGADRVCTSGRSARMAPSRRAPPSRPSSGPDRDHDRDRARPPGRGVDEPGDAADARSAATTRMTRVGPLGHGDHADAGHAGGGRPGPGVLVQPGQRAADRRPAARARRPATAPTSQAASLSRSAIAS